MLLLFIIIMLALVKQDDIYETSSCFVFQYKSKSTKLVRIYLYVYIRNTFHIIITNRLISSQVVFIQSEPHGLPFGYQTPYRTMVAPSVYAVQLINSTHGNERHKQRASDV